ncbi:MAG: hypothetical protein M3Z09_16050 [Acidobacteriota bacterium]|nr:hypothetical protein [Acidobacteriota bacterium]
MSSKKKAPPAKAANASQSVLHDGILVRPAPNSQPRNEFELQLQTFDRAMRLFRAQQFGEAKVLLTEAIIGPQKEIAHNARLHIIMCDRRLNQPALSLESLEDHYNYAIERLNARDVEKARKHLDCAMSLILDGQNSSVDHLYYALALCAGLSGDTEGAYENLKEAIALNPRNRAAARQDSDFAPVSQQPLIQQLLYPEKQREPH